MLHYLVTMSFVFALAVGAIYTTTEQVPTKTTTKSIFGVGCGEMCCDGKNNSCHSTGPKINGRGTVSSRCFCDEGCPAMGDCCFDYRSACKVVDCQMSEWSEYSECSSECGFGSKTRHRNVLVKPRFGGSACPTNLRETTICTGKNCIKTNEDVEEEIEKETAKIMPASFGKFRNMVRYNANMDIRRNLFYQYYYKNAHKYTSYCSKFKVLSSRRACQSYATPWANVLKAGATICVECQQTAMEKETGNGLCAGHGEVGVSTNWNAVNAAGCTGWWERMDDTEGCSCSKEGTKSNDFIFV